MRAMWKVLGLTVAMLLAPSSLAATECRFGTPGTTQRIAIADTGRAMLVHFPAAAPRRAAPLVWLFHGSTGSGANILRASKLAETADAHGFVVAAPDGGIAADGGFAWNIPGVPTVTGKIPGPEDPDDVAFVKVATGWLAKAGCIDPRRVYATGLSGGGRMASWLACVAAQRFAAIAPVVGLRAGNPLASDPSRPDPATCRPARAMPVLAFAGDKDRANPIEGGGARYWQYPMSAALARWARLDGCAKGPVTAPVSPSTDETRYSRCAGGVEVQGWIVKGRAHEWVADNDAMWAFLSRYRR